MLHKICYWIVAHSRMEYWRSMTKYEQEKEIDKRLAELRDIFTGR